MPKANWFIILFFINAWGTNKQTKQIQEKSHTEQTLPAGPFCCYDWLRTPTFQVRSGLPAVDLVWFVDYGAFSVNETPPVVCMVKYCCPPGKAVGCIVISWLGKITTLKPHNLLPHPVRTSERSYTLALVELILESDMWQINTVHFLLVHKHILIHFHMLKNFPNTNITVKLIIHRLLTKILKSCEACIQGNKC